MKFFYDELGMKRKYAPRKKKIETLSVDEDAINQLIAENPTHERMLRALLRKFEKLRNNLKPTQRYLLQQMDESTRLTYLLKNSWAWKTMTPTKDTLLLVDPLPATRISKTRRLNRKLSLLLRRLGIVLRN